MNPIQSRIDIEFYNTIVPGYNGVILKGDVKMVPTVGRIVYYNQGTKEAPKLLAAIITLVQSKDRVNLAIFTSSGTTYGMLNIDQGDEGGQWDWMPYQKHKAEDGG